MRLKMDSTWTREKGTSNVPAGIGTRKGKVKPIPKEKR
jgi:hypothetical protein